LKRDDPKPLQTAQYEAIGSPTLFFCSASLLKKDRLMWVPARLPLSSHNNNKTKNTTQHNNTKHKNVLLWMYACSHIACDPGGIGSSSGAERGAADDRRTAGIGTGRGAAGGSGRFAAGGG
jgi:hypothetical protein